MAETPEGSESLIILSELGRGPYLDGLLAERLSVSTTLLAAITSGAAPYATYVVEQDVIQLDDSYSIKGLKSGALTFDLGNVELEYTQVGPPEKAHPDEHVPGFAPFQLMAHTWKPGAVYGVLDGRFYALNCTCIKAPGLPLPLEFSDRCPMHTFKGDTHVV